ncbi:MAG: universal stress protein [Trueperaceae bacterium]|nr:universal stress protein [Trueperaceae bacterium]
MTQRKVMIPLDGSEFSRSAFRTLGRLFEPATTAVTLVQVGEVPEGAYVAPRQPVVVGTEVSWPVESKGHSIYSTQAWQSARAEVEVGLADDAQRLRDAGYTVYAKALFGDPAQEIADAADSGGFDAIVMATHGRSGLSRALLGSVAEKVMRMALVPVIMTRPRTEETEYGPFGALN